MNDREFDALISKLRKKSEKEHAKLDALRKAQRFDDDFDQASKRAFAADNELSFLLQKRERERNK